jgi:hypothetical protein
VSTRRRPDVFQARGSSLSTWSRAAPIFSTMS